MCFYIIHLQLLHQYGILIYTTKIDEVVCPPNISETVADRPMKLTHRQRITSTTIKLNLKKNLLSILSILVKTIQRIVADQKRKLSPPFDSADSVPSLGHPAPGSGKMMSLFTVLCDYQGWVTETGAPGSGKSNQNLALRKQLFPKPCSARTGSESIHTAYVHSHMNPHRREPKLVPIGLAVSQLLKTFEFLTP